MLNPNLTKEDAQWLVNVFNPMRYGRIASSTIGMFVKATNLISNKNLSVPSCGCEYKTTAAIANSYYNQYQSEIETLATKTTRGRKKKS